MKKKLDNVVKGLAIIAFAVCIFLNSAGMLPGLPLVKIGLGIVLAVLSLYGLFDKNFVGCAIGVGLIGVIFKAELGIPKVSTWIIIVCAVLVGIGFELIFKKNKININITKDGKTIDTEGTSEYWEQEGEFDLDNNLGSKTHYVSIANLRKGKVDNALGSLTVYFNGTTVAPEGAFLDIDNGLGNLALYFPADMRVKFNFENGLGRINVHGEGSQDADKPLVTANVDNGLGNIDIYFE